MPLRHGSVLTELLAMAGRPIAPYIPAHDAKAAKQDIRRLVGRRRRLPVHDDGLCRRLFLRRLLRCARERVRRPPRRDLAGLLDLGLPLFPARLSGRPDRRPDRAAPRRDRRPAAGRRSGLVAAAQASSLWQIYLGYGVGVGVGVGLSYVPSIAAVQRWFVRRRGTASGARRRGHRRRHPDRRAAGARVDRRRSAGARPISCSPR